MELENAYLLGTHTIDTRCQQSEENLGHAAVVASPRRALPMVLLGKHQLSANQGAERIRPGCRGGTVVYKGSNQSKEIRLIVVLVSICHPTKREKTCIVINHDRQPTGRNTSPYLKEWGWIRCIVGGDGRSCLR